MNLNVGIWHCKAGKRAAVGPYAYTGSGANSTITDNRYGWSRVLSGVWPNTDV